MTGLRLPQHDSAAIRQSVIEAVRRLENGNGAAPADEPAGDFRRLTDALPHAAFVWLGIKIVYANRAACKLLGVDSAESLIGQRATDVMQPEDRDALSRLLLKGARSASTPESQRFTVRRGDGSSLSVQVQLVTLDWQNHPAILAIIPDGVSLGNTAETVARRAALNGQAKAPGADEPHPRTEPVDPPPEIDEADWWDETRAPLTSYGDDLGPAPGVAADRPAQRPDARDLAQVPAAIADTVLALPPGAASGAILVDPAAALRCNPGLILDGIAGLAAPRRPPELDEAQRLSETALAAATNGIAIVDALADGQPIIYVNAAFEGITGYAFDEAVGRGLAALLGGDSGPDGIEALARAAGEGRPGTARINSHRRGGGGVCSDIHLVPAADGAGRVTHLIAIQEEVTGRVDDEAARREAEARLAAFTGTAAEWFWETDADLRYTYLSERYFELSGDRPGDVLGRMLHEFQSEAPAVERERFLAAVRTRRPFSGHAFSRVCADGRTLRISASGVPVTDDAGKFRGYRGSARNMAADLAAVRARGEADAANERAAAIEAARDFYRAILDNASAPMCCIDQEGHLSHANKALGALLGRSVDGSKLGEVLPEAATRTVMDAAAGIFATGEPADAEVVLEGAGSPGRAFRIALAPLRTAGNAVALVQASWTETTGARAAESAQQEIASLVGALEASEERRVAAEAAIRDTVEAAEAARSEAQEANAAKQRFIAGIGHEIRTPLNGMLGMAGLLIDSRLTEDQRHHAETIRQSGKAVLNVLNDMIELAKLKDGSAPLESSEFEFRSVAESVVEILAASAFARGLDLGAYIAPNVPEWLAGDAGRLRQVLFNLIGNAINRTVRGAVTVKINLAEQDADRMILLARVANTGAAVAAETPSGSLEIGGRRPAPSRGGPQTTGFALDICREIVRLMNGEIGVETQPGGAPVVWIRIALGRARSAPRTRLAPYIAALNGRRALVIGGNPVTRQLLCKQLRAFGMTIRSVATGEEGLAALADAAGRAPYDVALADLALADMEATELAQRARDLPRVRGLKLVLTAPTGRNVSRSRARELGFEAVLRKPIRQETLVRRCAALFGVDSADGWSPAPAAPRNATGRSLRILVAEDNPANQQIVAHMLIAAGHRVDVANNGIEAVNAIRNVPFDIALMDIGMPEMDGLTAAKLVRSFAEGGAALPLIAMTGANDRGRRERFLEAGMNAVIEKPVDVAALERAIEDLCLPEEDSAPPALPREPRQVPPITPTEREELKNLLASLDGIVEARR